MTADTPVRREIALTSCSGSNGFVTSTLFGVGPAVVLGGVLTLGVVGIWWFAFPGLRDIDRFEDITLEEPCA